MALTDEDKLLNEGARIRLNRYRTGRSVVFTNGCFDLLHRGHLRFLERALDAGGLLVVGVNSDDSVRRLKGVGRPVINQQDRRAMVDALFIVQETLLFDEDTPLELIKMLRPDVLAKGGDYAEKDVVGADFVKSYGGRVEIVPLELGYSTSSIIKKIKEMP